MNEPGTAKMHGIFEVRIHGRGGQGVVTAAEVLSMAAFAEGRHAQAFPSFGSERTGAPVVAFCRIGARPIRTREPVAEPDALIVQDPTLLHQVNVFGGLRDNGYALINSARDLDELGLGDWAAPYARERLMAVPALEIAREHTGHVRANAALLGGLAALTGVVGVESVAAAIQRRFPGPLGDSNAAAARACHDYVLAALGAAAHA
jgi:pyruvate ferredoxin oxidoreductase gamma subunit